MTTSIAELAHGEKEAYSINQSLTQSPSLFDDIQPTVSERVGFNVTCDT